MEAAGIFAGPAGLNGNLRLVCASAPGRGTFVVEQAFAAPFHISKSYWDGDTLLVHLVNPTAGVFGGDRLRTHVTVQAGARVLLSSPSATRFHPSKDRSSHLEQTFEVHAGGSLDIFPEISIPQQKSRVRQSTIIHLNPGAELVFLETLAPGRVASGEVYAFDEYAWSTDITVGARHVLRERATIRPGDESMAGLRALFPVGYHASVVVISPSLEILQQDFAREVAALSRVGELIIAASTLAAHGWLIRILAGNGIAFQDGIRKVRVKTYTALGRRLPDERRNAL
jgi:urease accessory protein